MKNSLRKISSIITLTALGLSALAMANTTPTQTGFIINYVSGSDVTKNLACISTGGVSVGGGLCAPKADPSLYSGIQLGHSGTIMKGNAITFYGSGTKQLYVQTTETGTVRAVNKNGNQFQVSIDGIKWSANLRATKSNVLYIRTV